MQATARVCRRRAVDLVGDGQGAEESVWLVGLPTTVIWLARLELDDPPTMRLADLEVVGTRGRGVRAAPAEVVDPVVAVGSDLELADPAERRLGPGPRHQRPAGRLTGAGGVRVCRRDRPRAARPGGCSSLRSVDRRSCRTPSIRHRMANHTLEYGRCRDFQPRRLGAGRALGRSAEGVAGFAVEPPGRTAGRHQGQLLLALRGARRAGGRGLDLWEARSTTAVIDQSRVRADSTPKRAAPRCSAWCSTRTRSPAPTSPCSRSPTMPAYATLSSG